jgi:hypothetical protein
VLAATIPPFHPCWFPANYMEFIFYGKTYVVKNDRKFPRCGYIRGIRVSSSLPRTISAGMVQWSKHVLQCWRPRVRVPQLTSLRFFLIIHDHLHSFTAKHPNVYCHWYFRTFGRINFHSWVYLYCMSIPTKDKVHFLWIFSLSGNFDFATILSRNRPVNIRGELLELLWVICRFLVASPADWITCIARILQFLITACYGGHAPKFPPGNLGTAFPLQIHLKCCNDAGLAGCWL